MGAKRGLIKTDTCLKIFPSFHAKRELLAGTLNMPVSGGGWIVASLVF
jgi:hypothetical protein